MPKRPPDNSAADAYLAGCLWSRDLKEAQLVWPGISLAIANLEHVSMGDLEVWGMMIGFSETIAGPLAEHIAQGQASDSPLQSVLVSLLTDGPELTELQTTQVILETVRQAAGLISGEVDHPALGGVRRRIDVDSEEGSAAVRRSIALGVLREIRVACHEAQRQRPRFQKSEVLDLLETCVLPFMHTRQSRDAQPSLSVAGAELGVEVDGLLLEEVRLALEACYKRVRQDGSEMGRRLAEAYPEDDLYFACLSPDDCAGLLACLQDKVRVRDLTSQGVERSRAKRLLKMRSTAVLFSVFRQLHLQLKRFDLLVGLCARLVPLTSGTQGFYSPYGRLPTSIRWGFLGPGRSHNPVRCSVVVADLSRLIREASRRASRDRSSRALNALWSSWEALSLEAEAVGGIAMIQGSHGIGLFHHDEHAQEFASAIRRRYQVPIDLSEQGSEDPIVLPPVEVALRVERGPVYGFIGPGIQRVWGEPLQPSAEQSLPEQAPRGFSILTEFGDDDDTEIHAEETFISDDGAPFFQAGKSEDSSSDTLDAFFLPTKTEPRAKAVGATVDLGIDSDALVEILEGYGVYRHAADEWSFGRLMDSTLNDHHRIKGKGSLKEATSTLILKKMGEGFAPRTDSRLELDTPEAFQELSDTLLREAYRQLTGASG